LAALAKCARVRPSTARRPSPRSPKKKLAAAIAQNKTGEMVHRSGWDHKFWPRTAVSSRQDLDSGCPTIPFPRSLFFRPVAVVQFSRTKTRRHHRQNPNPPAVKSNTIRPAEPDGRLKEGSAISFGRGTKIRPPHSNDRRQQNGIELVLADVADKDVTSIKTIPSRRSRQSFAAHEATTPWDDFLTYAKLKSEGKLTVRITKWTFHSLARRRLEQMRKGRRHPRTWLRNGAPKRVTDVSSAPALPPCSRPIPTIQQHPESSHGAGEKLKSSRLEARKAGFNSHFHAIGDRANRVVLDHSSRCPQSQRPGDRRESNRTRRTSSPLPTFALRQHASIRLHAAIDQNKACAAGPKKARAAPTASRGLRLEFHSKISARRLAFGTTYDVDVIKPVPRTLRLASPWKLRRRPRSGWQPQEKKISVDDCIRALHSGSPAYAEFHEKEKRAN